MNIDKRYKPGKIPVDEIRPRIQHPFLRKLDNGDGQIEATDGHILAIMPVSNVENDIAGKLPVGMFEFANKKLPQSVNLQAEADAKYVYLKRMFSKADAGIRIERPEDPAGVPDTHQILTDAKKAKKILTACINIDYLVKLVDAIGVTKNAAFDGERKIYLTFPEPVSDTSIGGKSVRGPILVTPTEDQDLASWGILMPVRADATPKKIPTG
jgi:hypothetical protein